MKIQASKLFLLLDKCEKKKELNKQTTIYWKGLGFPLISAFIFLNEEWVGKGEQ